MHTCLSHIRLPMKSPTRRTVTSALQHAFEEDKNYCLKEEINTPIKRKIGGGGKGTATTTKNS